MDERINEALRLALAGRLDLEGYARRMAEAGVERFTVDVTSDTVTYEGAGRTIVRRVSDFAMEPRGEFDGERLSEIFGAFRRGEMVYPVFLRWIAQAGVEAFEVVIASGRVEFRGRGGSRTEAFRDAGRKARETNRGGRA